MPPNDRQRHRAVGQVRQGAQEATAWDPRALPQASANQRDRGHQQQDQGDRANGLAGPRLVRTQPARPTPPQPRNSLYEKTLTLASPADRPVRAPAHAVAFTTTATAIRGAGSVRRPRLTAGVPAAGVAGHSDSLLANHRPEPRTSSPRGSSRRAFALGSLSVGALTPVRCARHVRRPRQWCHHHPRFAYPVPRTRRHAYKEAMDEVCVRLVMARDGAASAAQGCRPRFLFTCESQACRESG